MKAKRTGSAIFLIAAAGAHTVALGEDPATLVYGNVSGWTVRTDPADAYRCFAEAEYEGGSFVRIGVAPNDEIYAVISDASWSGAIEPTEYVVDLSFDDDAPHSFVAHGMPDSDALRLSIPEEVRNAFRSEFAGSHSLSARLGSRHAIVLSLGGSSNATRMLDECQVEMAKVGPASPR